MKTFLASLLSFLMAVTFPLTTMAASKPLTIQLSPEIDATLYSYQKTKDYIAVELGFTNKTNKDVTFNMDQIFLKDNKQYAVEPIPYDNLRTTQYGTSNQSWMPLALITLLGVASIANASGNDTFSRAMTIAALGVGGIFIISSILQSKGQNKELVTFENNSINSVKKIPAGMTLGGFIYFPKIKNPTQVVLVRKKGKTTEDQFALALKGIPKSRKAKNVKSIKNVMAPYSMPGYGDAFPQNNTPMPMPMPVPAQ